MPLRAEEPVQHTRVARGEVALTVGVYLPGKWGLSHGRDRRRRATIGGMESVTWAYLDVICLLFAGAAGLAHWRRVRERRAGEPVTGLQRLRAVGWGAALVPVTALYL